MFFPFSYSKVKNMSKKHEKATRPTLPEGSEIDFPKPWFYQPGGSPYFGENLDLEDKDLTQPEKLASFRSKLKILYELTERVSNPTWSLSLEEAVELLQDLALIFQGSDLITNLGSHVEEKDYLSDDLGNICMVTKTDRTRLSSEILISVGEVLAMLAHQLFQKGLHERQIDLRWQHVDLEMFDDYQSEDILVGKELIQKLRKENNRLDRRNWFLVQKIYILEEKISRMQMSQEERNERWNFYLHFYSNWSDQGTMTNLALDLWIHWEISYIHQMDLQVLEQSWERISEQSKAFVIPPSTLDVPSIENSSFDEKGSFKDHPRKVSEQRIHGRQLDVISFDDD